MAGFDESFDWVVVGSGAGSMTSGMLMRQAGKSVVVLEKTGLFGGTTCKSGGVMWIPNNPFMDPGEDSPEKAISYLDAVVGDDSDAPGTSHEKRLAYVNEAPKMVNFLLGQGIALERGSKFWPDYYDNLPGGCETSRTVTALPFNKKELGAWAPKLRQGFIEMPVRLDDGMQFAFMKHSWDIKLLFAKTALAVVWGKLTGKQWTTAGACLQGRMLKAGLEKGVDVRLQSPVSELVIESGPNSSNRVTGVVTVKDGKPWRIGCNLGVLVNAGGFAQNQAMRDKYLPGTRAEWSNVPEGDTGEMHVEMERIGGVLAQMDEMVGYPGTLSPGWEKEYVKPGMQGVTAKPHAILVDQAGVRYMNEACSYELYCETMLKHANAVPSWAIMDAQYMEEYQLVGSVGIKKKPKSWHDSNYLKQSDTIEGLAKEIGADPATLKATVDRWNAMMDKGADEDFQRGVRFYDRYLGDPFAKPSATLGDIRKGPFYAVDVIPGDVSTYGGVVTDVNSRVVKADGSVIEGLYATGVSTASPMGRVYPGAGASVGPSMCFGWIAAKHAAGLGNQAI